MDPKTNFSQLNHIKKTPLFHMSLLSINGKKQRKCHIPATKKPQQLSLLNKRDFLLILWSQINWITGVSSKSKPNQSYRYSMKTEYKRLCIYPKDIQRITGKSYRQSIRLLQNIRKEHNKLQNELVSIEEFCQYTSLKMEQVELLIIG
ncbi:hypothetical protein [Flavobacterium gillisiae]|uniref:hypothetical protein n=1 Tax=Flavobacterium gillisiae TaxID=150146 RepID=UPI000A59C2FE|nr:hypothetical protein [Flavobacterium gillisiae]